MSDAEPMSLADIIWKARAEAAEARCKRLEGALRFYADGMSWVSCNAGATPARNDQGQRARAALPDTAQQETTGAEYNVAEGKAYDEGEADGKLLGSKDMREMAAKLAEGWWPSTPLNMLAARIRALPIDPDTGGE